MALNSAGMILRTDTYAPLTTKGSELTWSELDQNFVKLYQDMAAKVKAGAVPDYDSSTVYSLTQVANYNDRTWTFVNSTPTDGVEPGSDPLYWAEIDPAALAHRQNTDTMLAEGTADEVTAADLRALVDGGGGSSDILSVEVELTRAQILALHTTPVVLIPAVGGSGIEVVSPPFLKMLNDGTGFTFASGDTVQVFNGSTNFPLIAAFGDAYIMSLTSGVFVSTFFGNYEITSGPVSLKATFPITDGGAGATFTVRIRYRVVPL